MPTSPGNPSKRHAFGRLGRSAAVVIAVGAVAATTAATYGVTPTGHPATIAATTPPPAPELMLGQVSHIASSRVKESSGVAASYRYPDVGYTLNDNSEDRQTVYSFRISTGQVLGRTELPYRDRGDTESIYADPAGRVWVGDLGDNEGERTDAAIIRFNEPGPADGTPTGLVRFPVRYSDGKPNVEAMLVNPVNDQVYLINKMESEDSTLYRLPATLAASRTNVATPTSVTMPAGVGDAVISRNGRTVIVRTDDNIQFFRTPTWNRYAVFDVPSLKNPESVTIEPDQTTFLFGSEGKNSPIYRYPVPS